jgi:DNA repair protein RadC
MKNLHDKLMSRGAVSLSDAELLAILVESATDQRDPKAVAEGLLTSCGSLAGVARSDLSRLRMVEGIGLKRAERMVVAAEFGRRIARATTSDVECIKTDEDVARLMRPIFEGMQHEECWVLYLTSSNRLIERQRVSQGGVQATVVDHRLIVKRALELLATQLIMVHNHPSGAAEPSLADKELTKKVKSAAALFDIRMLDHVIISREGNFSFRREGIL